MKLILHIVRKDFRRLRAGVLLLWAVTLAKFGFGWWLMLGSPNDLGAWPDFQKVATALAGVEAVLTWLLTGLLVLEDPLRGAEPAWRTRPIAGGRLLAAKVSGALLMLASPVVLVGAPWWVFHGFGMRDMLIAGAMGIGLQVLVIVPSLFFASLVDTVARYVVWSVVGTAVWMVSPLAWSIALSLRVPVGATGLLLIVAAIMAAMLGVVLHRFRCRVPLPVLVGAVGAIVAGVLGGGNWAVSWVQAVNQGGWGDRNEEAVKELQITWVNGSIRDVPTYGNRNPYAVVSSSLRATGFPRGTTLDVWQSDHEWRWTADAKVQSQGYGSATQGSGVEQLGLPKRTPDPETEAWLAEQRKQREAKESPGWAGVGVPALGGNITAITTVLPSVAARLRREPSTLNLKLSLLVSRESIWGELPLVVGAQCSTDGHRMRVVSRATEGARAVIVQMVDSQPAWAGSGLLGPVRNYRGSRFYAIDREKGEFARLYDDKSASVMIAGAEIRTNIMTTYAPFVIRAGKRQVADPQWLERTRVVLIGYDEVARVTRELKGVPFIVTVTDAAGKKTDEQKD